MSFGNRHRLSKSAKIEKKFEWADDAYHFLEEHFTQDKIIEIRKSCRCNDGKSIANKMAKYRNKSNNKREFVDLFNQNESFACLEYISENSILFCYPQCYCTLGNAEGIFGAIPTLKYFDLFLCEIREIKKTLDTDKIKKTVEILRAYDSIIVGRREARVMP